MFLFRYFLPRVEVEPVLVEVDEDSAVMDQEPQRLERAAHSLKGELSYIGATEVSQVARRLEEMGRNRELEGAGGVLATLEGQLSDFVAIVRNAVGASCESVDR